MHNFTDHQPRNGKLPPLLLEAFLGVLREMEIETRFEEGEADAACVELAVRHNAWILSNGELFSVIVLCLLRR